VRPRAQNDALDLQHFVQQLAVRLTGWEATTFLVGEYQPSEIEHNPVFTVADGLLWLYQSVDRNSMVRKMQAAGFQAHVRKPLEPTELIAAIADLTANSKT